ncbi:MAG: tautomerase family protein [Acidobacteriota bacterium]|nr:tautomerase family protein [Acidobacteriota bacterium]
MPLVTVTLREGKSPEYLKKVGDAIHAALVEKAPIPVGDRFQIFHEVPPAHLDVDPAFAGSNPVERSHDVLIIQITLNAGRTDITKSAIYAEIVARLHNDAGVRPDDVFISLIEVMKQNWSMASGVMTYPDLASPAVVAETGS